MRRYCNFALMTASPALGKVTPNLLALARRPTLTPSARSACQRDHPPQRYSPSLT
ncbi:MAG: hypothetical protein JW850_04985 [Thermoflexales bacterium]|nr:hypothetical protein [Thermoflexales bacterium]